MDNIGNQKIWAYFDENVESRPATNLAIRGGDGHTVKSYFELAKKVAELQFRNRDHVLLFRGQARDHLTIKGNTSLKASLFRLNDRITLTDKTLEERFLQLVSAEAELVRRYAKSKFLGYQRLKRHRILRWAILQHYEVCLTPLLDVTHSLRIAASFASLGKVDSMAFIFVLGVPNLSGAITASSEAGLQIVRLSSVCPPDAIRPHVQEGYLVGEYPEIADFNQTSKYSQHEMDFGRRLVAKFRFDPSKFWDAPNYTPVPVDALYPKGHRDLLLDICDEIQKKINSGGK